MLPPWKRKNPAKKRQNMTPEQIARARERAEKAGRRYPNWVDNAAVLREEKTE